MDGHAEGAEIFFPPISDPLLPFLPGGEEGRGGGGGSPVTLCPASKPQSLLIFPYIYPIRNG